MRLKTPDSVTDLLWKSPIKVLLCPDESRFLRCYNDLF